MFLKNDNETDPWRRRRLKAESRRNFSLIFFLSLECQRESTRVSVFFMFLSFLFDDARQRHQSCWMKNSLIRLGFVVILNCFRSIRTKKKYVKLWHVKMFRKHFNLLFITMMSLCNICVSKLFFCYKKLFTISFQLERVQNWKATVVH